MEQYCSTHYPGGSVKYDFVWTTQLLKDIKLLSFGGEDLIISYVSQICGILVFSLAPVSKSSMVSRISLRQRMLHFENMESNHLPTDASEMADLSTTGDAIPGTCAKTQAWMDHVGIMRKMLMGDACPLNRCLDAVRSRLQKPHWFASWLEAEWKSLVWASHMAY
jgi:hypothetical protein